LNAPPEAAAAFEALSVLPTAPNWNADALASASGFVAIAELGLPKAGALAAAGALSFKPPNWNAVPPGGFFAAGATALAAPLPN
jgi:hypothetical protein